MQTSRQPVAGFIARLVGIALIFAPACSESAGPNYPTGCMTSTVTVTVSPGLTPEFSWTPDCGVWALQVIAVTPANQTMWATTRPLSKNELTPPVTYGIHPAGALEEGGLAAVPLQAGVTYEVILQVMSDALTHRTAGQKSFTP